MARRKPARVVTGLRQADEYFFLRVLECFSWITVGTFFSRTGMRHGMAVVILDVNSGEMVPPTPHTFGFIKDRSEERERVERCKEKCFGLLGAPDCWTSSQVSDALTGAIRLFKDTPQERVFGLCGLGGTMNEAVLLAACKRTWVVSEKESISISFRSGLGPNTNINTTKQYESVLRLYLKGRDVMDFKPDFENLVNFDKYLV